MRRQREREQLQRQAELALQQLGAAQASFEAMTSLYGEHLSCDASVPTGRITRMANEELTSFLSDVATAKQQYESALDSGVEQARQAFLQARVIPTEIGESSEDRLVQLVAELRQSVAIDRREEEFVAALANLHPAVDAAVVDELGRWVDEASSGGQITVDALLMDLRHRVTSANERARQQLAATTELDELALSLAGRSGLEVTMAEAAMDRARKAGVVDDALRALVADAVAADDERAEQAMALNAASTVLADLGYDVTGDFATLKAGAFTDIAKPEWGDYHVRVRRAKRAQELRFNVVRTAESTVDDQATNDQATNDQASEDRVAEERWCEDYAHLQRALAEVGVDLATKTQVAPGEQPVPLAAPVADVADTTGEGDDAQADSEDELRRRAPDLKEMTR